MYFDVTNMHFEIDKPDDLRKYGKEKNNRPDPIVQFALAMDASGLPLYYIIADPKKYNKSTAYGAASYIKNIAYDKKTGEVYEKAGKALLFDEEKAIEDAKYDGYYCLVTSELDMPQTRVVEIYRGLSDIEDSFKVTKSNLDIRPFYVSLKDHINAHMLTCFISLLIVRLIQKKTGYCFTPEKIVETLNNISCSLEHENIYLFDCRNGIIEAIGKAFGIDFTKKRLPLNKIKNILANAKI